MLRDESDRFAEQPLIAFEIGRPRLAGRITMMQHDLNDMQAALQTRDDVGLAFDRRALHAGTLT